MTENELKARVKNVALRVIRMVRALPNNTVANVLGKQVVRSATSSAANYRAACKARSKAEFVSKLGIVEEEIDETQFWLELIVDSHLMKISRLKDLQKEVTELTAIFAASRITARKNK